MMVDKSSTRFGMGSPSVYRIEVCGTLDPNRADSLADLNISFATSEADGPLTTLVGTFADQAALSGLLNTIYELHVPLVAVERLDRR